MLSLKHLESADQAVGYYEKDDYYTGGQDELKAAGEWFGQGVERLDRGLDPRWLRIPGLDIRATGLHAGDPVDRDDLHALLDGNLPNGRRLGRVIDGERAHTPGWDLTFSAPKSVSILSEIGGDERLHQAHDEAVKAALTWIEDNLVVYRHRGPDGVQAHLAGNLIAALFQHATSRDKDPQLHTHAVLINAVQREDGRWASIHSRPLFEAKMLAGTLYRSELAARVQALGYRVERTEADGRFEIAEVPEAVRARFQSRRDKIEQVMKHEGLSSAEDAATIAVRTRNAKVAVSREHLLAGWTGKAQATGFDLAQAVHSAQLQSRPERADRYAAQLQSAAATAALHSAVERLSESEAVFRESELLRWGLAGSIGQARLPDIERAIAQEIAAGRLHAVTLGGHPAYTTASALDQERRLLDIARAGRGAAPAIDTAEALRPALSASTLDPGQCAAVALIVTVGDRIVGVQGRAGTGKTTMLSVAREHLEAKGYTVHGMAQNSGAARNLRDGSGIASTTLRRQLNIAQKAVRRLSGAEERTRQAIRTEHARQVWVVDEAGQASVRDLLALTQAAEQLGIARLALVGDRRQLGAIEAGQPFTQLLDDGLKSAQMDHIRRQHDASQRRAVEQVYEGKLRAALTTLGPRVREIGDAGARRAAIVEDWKRLGPARDQTLILTASNREKAQLTDALRQVLRDEGRLAGEQAQRQLVRVFSRAADRVDAGFYRAGDVVHFPRKLASLGIERGDYRRVVAVDKAQNRVTLAPANDGVPAIEWDPSATGTGARGAELYRARETTLAPGETIRWTRNSPAQGLVNGQPLHVTAVDGQRIEARTEAGQPVSIDTARDAGRHWEHGAVSTVYAAQGRTAQHVLVDAPSDQPGLFDRPAFLVGISRQRESLTVYTDDRARLASHLEQRTGEKTRALDAVPEHLPPPAVPEPPAPESRLQALIDDIARQCQEVMKRHQDRGRERHRDCNPSFDGGRPRDRDFGR